MAVLAESAMTDIFRIPSTGLSAQKAVVDGARKGLDQTGRLFALAGGALSASLNALQSLQLDPKLISCLHNSLDQHCGGVLEAARSPRFWRRTVGPALDAAAISAAILTRLDRLQSQEPTVPLWWRLRPLVAAN